MTTKTEPVLLTYKQVAAILNLSLATIYALARRGELSVIRIGASSRISRAELDRFLSTVTPKRA